MFSSSSSFDVNVSLHQSEYSQEHASLHGSIISSRNKTTSVHKRKEGLVSLPWAHSREDTELQLQLVDMVLHHKRSLFQGVPGAGKTFLLLQTFPFQTLNQSSIRRERHYNDLMSPNKQREAFQETSHAMSPSSSSSSSVLTQVFKGGIYYFDLNPVKTISQAIMMLASALSLTSPFRFEDRREEGQDEINALHQACKQYLASLKGRCLLVLDHATSILSQEEQNEVLSFFLSLQHGKLQNKAHLLFVSSSTYDLYLDHVPTSASSFFSSDIHEEEQRQEGMEESIAF
jgi:predicted ATPase